MVNKIYEIAIHLVLRRKEGLSLFFSLPLQAGSERRKAPIAGPFSPTGQLNRWPEAKK